MNDALTWTALIAAAGSIVAVVRFWLDMGKAAEKAEQAATAAALVAAKLDLTSAALADFRVVVAQTYATNRALSETEQALALGLNEAVKGIYSRLDTMTARLNSLITIARQQ